MINEYSFKDLSDKIYVCIFNGVADEKKNQPVFIRKTNFLGLLA